MAWIRWRVTRRGGRMGYVQWREAGRVRSERVSTDPRVLAAVVREKGAVEDAARDAAPSGSGRDIVDRFVASLEQDGRADGTVRYYRGHLDRWLAWVGSTPPHSWARRDLDAYMAAHREWVPRTRRMIVQALRRLRSWAASAGVHVADATRGVSVAPARPRERVALTPEQVDALLRAVPPHYRVAVALAAYAGLSLGDLTAVTWEEVDCGWVYRRQGRAKTGVRLRVPILPVLADELRAARPLHATGPVCARLAKGASATAVLRRAFARAKVPRQKGDAWHLLRHSFGTLLMRAGVPAVVIGRLLSHQPGSVVTARYQHPDDGDLVAAMEAVGRRLAAERAKA